MSTQAVELQEAAADHVADVLHRIEEAARRENGWRVIGMFEAPVQIGARQHGKVAFTRAPKDFVGDGGEAGDGGWDDVGAHGTATWVYRAEDGAVFFEGGRYDLSRAEALEDLVAAIDRGGR